MPRLPTYASIPFFPIEFDSDYTVVPFDPDNTNIEITDLGSNQITVTDLGSATDEIEFERLES